MHHLAGNRHRQRGQAAVEYLVVAGVIATALLAGGDTAPMKALTAALHSFFDAYSYMLSLP
ncbi:hypothetical protein [Burkholderia cenocepacia]|jgi:Flp pilus assembly pilin Flp|uniref:hypothetical protein n=1 Tax=Burkholderia cenocepacia TaxID=95486 RepID=UPI00264CF9AC|nr:hypothetical protein [Burkholderia cenocepacia]MDN7452310.1 hypothetical protein [Burkholderia cenocepacia]